MIREFWQEYREEKKRQKQLKKANRKQAKTGEQKAYSIFGILLTIFVIFGAFGSTCSRGNADNVEFDWGSIVGVDDAMIEVLSAPVNRNEILIDGTLTTLDFDNLAIELNANGLGAFLEEGVDDDLTEEDLQIKSDFSLTQSALGALVSDMMEGASNGDGFELLSFKMFENEDSHIILRTVVYLDLSQVVPSDKLPMVYVTTTSRIQMQINELVSFNNYVQLNQIDDEMNEEIVDKINNSSFSEIAYHTNNAIVGQLNLFAEFINAKICLENDNIIFQVK